MSNWEVAKQNEPKPVQLLRRCVQVVVATPMLLSILQSEFFYESDQ
jgi:hypothetical protein